MRPYGFDETEQLRYAKARARMLADEWRTANWPAAGPGADAASPEPLSNAVKWARRGAGGVLIALGRRLLPAETGPRPVVGAARQAGGGC